jgi:hypothetical protein
MTSNGRAGRAGYFQGTLLKKARDVTTWDVKRMGGKESPCVFPVLAEFYAG